MLLRLTISPQTHYRRSALSITQPPLPREQSHELFSSVTLSKAGVERGIYVYLL